MSTGPQDVIGTKSALQGTARTCVFFQAAFVPTPQGENTPTGMATRLSVEGVAAHSCMLNPGRSCGPDGEAIAEPLCTLERQGICQVQRRQAFARLVATMPAFSASGKQGIGF